MISLPTLPSWTLKAVVAVGIALAAYLAWSLWLDARDQGNQEIGASVQREGDLRETMKRVETANEARNEVSADARARHAQCLRSARTPANCERLLLGGQADQR